MSVLDFGLGMIGMPANEITDLKVALPTLSALAEEAKELEPILEKARPHIEAMIPHIQALLPMLTEAAPTLRKMWPQIVSVTPLLKELIDFVETKA